MSFSVPQIMAFHYVSGGADLASFQGPPRQCLVALPGLKNSCPCQSLRSPIFSEALWVEGFYYLHEGSQRRINAAYCFDGPSPCGRHCLLFAQGFGFYEEAEASLAAMLAALAPLSQPFLPFCIVVRTKFQPGLDDRNCRGVRPRCFLGGWVSFPISTWNWQLVSGGSSPFSGSAPRSLRAMGSHHGRHAFLCLGQFLAELRGPRATGAGLMEMAQVNAIVEKTPIMDVTLPFWGTSLFCSARRKMPSSCTGSKAGVGSAWEIPLVKEKACVELAWQFLETSDHFDGWAVFYEVGPERLSLYSISS